MAESRFQWRRFASEIVAGCIVFLFGLWIGHMAEPRKEGNVIVEIPKDAGATRKNLPFGSLRRTYVIDFYEYDPELISRIEVYENRVEGVDARPIDVQMGTKNEDRRVTVTGERVAVFVHQKDLAREGTRVGFAYAQTWPCLWGLCL